MNASDLLDEIFKNYADVGSSIAKQMEAHTKSLALINNALKKEYDNGFNAGKKEGENQSVQNLIKKN